jgi:hypothetical protein
MTANSRSENGVSYIVFLEALSKTTKSQNKMSPKKPVWLKYEAGEPK